ncbi:hypothetical protein [Natrinema amylolyticum]|uniref:hypothetical protein n=1 Tax=Natrinema amylolyticum TaxID=2878679 RepID=UPI001CF93C50|nr:hypothetical protein [Natrinema amylolyticum]
MATDPLAWTFGPHNSRLSRIATYAPYGLGGGLGLVVVLSGVTLAAHGAFDESTLAAILVFALVGGPASLLYWWALERYGSSGSKWFVQYAGTSRLTKRDVSIATVVGAILIAASIAVAPELLALLFAVVVLSVVLVSPLATAVALEPDERRLTLGDDAQFGGELVVDLENVTGVRRLSLGPLSRWQVVVVRRVHGPPLFVPVPNRHAETFDRALERGLAATPTAEPKSPGTTRPMRIVLATIGIGFLAIAIGLAVLVARTWRTGGGRAVYPIVLLVTFAVIALGYAGYESWLARRAVASDE